MKLIAVFKETLKRVLKSGWLNFRRNSYVSFGTTGVMALVLLLFLGLVAANFLAFSIVESLQDKVDVSVYFKIEAGEEEITAVQKDVSALDSVQFVKYISKDQALADFRVRHAGDALIEESLAELDVNPLQASLNIKANDPSKYPAIVEFLDSHRFRVLIDKINYFENEQVIQRVKHISDAVRNWGFLATIVLAAIAVLVTFNTIRLTIYNQKQEIEIMRLVGGSNWHIRAPYMIEGVLYGTFATLIALAVFYPVTYYLSPKVAVLMPGISLFGYFLGNVIRFSSLTLLVGVLLGTVSSLIAIRKFLKV